jgi:hypothetical protein
MMAATEKMTPEDLKNRLAAPHLEEVSAEDLKAEAAEAVGAVPKEADNPDLRGHKEYTFTINYKNARGKVYKGEFTNKIITIRERQQIGIIRARLQGGLNSSAFDPLTEEINLMIAHLMVSLKEFPKWAEDIAGIEDVELLQTIHAEVASHEAYFFGWGSDEAKSEGES